MQSILIWFEKCGGLIWIYFPRNPQGKAGEVKKGEKISGEQVIQIFMIRKLSKVARSYNLIIMRLVISNL